MNEAKREEQFHGALSSAKEVHERYKALPIGNGWFGVQMIQALLTRYDEGERTDELLNEMESVE